MKKFASFATVAAVAMSVAMPSVAYASQDEAAATEAAAVEEAAAPAVEVKPRKMLYDANGSRLASIYDVTSEGNPRLILNGRMRTIPASTLSEVDGKITTSLTKSEIVHGS